MSHTAMFIAHYTDHRGTRVEVIPEPERVPGLGIKGIRYHNALWRRTMKKFGFVREYQVIGPKGRLP